MKIYVITHKKVKEIKNNCYELLQVGAEKNPDLGYLKDNVGENISQKNSNYCELTGLYWMWKNSTENIIGLCHYRRLFFKNPFSKKYSNLLNSEDIINYLKEYDIILPKQYYILKYNNFEQYAKFHNKNDLIECKKVIEKLYPEYIKEFDEVFCEHSFYPYNMFITKKSILDEYCQWLFNILFELESRIDISNYDSYNNRVFGFLSERLFNVWINHNHLRIKEKNVFNTEENILKNLIKNTIKKDLTKILLIRRR